MTAGVLSLVFAVVNAGWNAAESADESATEPAPISTPKPQPPATTTSATPASSVSAQPSHQPDVVTSTVTATPAPSPPPPRKPAIRSHGSLTVGYIQGGLKDLDNKPPTTVEHDGHGDVWFSSAGRSGNTLYAVDGARIASWENPDALPTEDECRYQAESGTGEHALGSGDVLCVRTSEGRTALLVVTVLSEPAKTGNLPTFDATVWELVR